MGSDINRAGQRKVVLIGTSLRDLPVQRHFAALGRELVDSGYQVALLVHGPIGDASYVDPRIRVLRWPSPRPTRFADALFFDRLVRRLRPCCLISNFGARAIMMTVGGLRRVPIRIHWHHTLSSQIAADWRGNRLLLRWLRLRARIPFHFVTHAVANSAAARQDLIQNFGVPAQKCRIFSNSLADPLSASASPLTTAAPDSRRFVCVGRFARSKGQDILVRAVARVVPRIPHITVEFIGDGPARRECERLADELAVRGHCVFAGSLPHQEVLEKMCAAWATIVPSRTEAFGLVNIESMAVGTPVIGSATGGIAEIVRDRLDGLLFPPGDEQALAQCMVELAESQELRSQMAANCRSRFLEKFELSRDVAAQADWINHLIEHEICHGQSA